MKGYQRMVNNYERNINCILADEMGLGKTLQSIAFIAHLVEVKKLTKGPYLFVVPLSVLFNWINEFRKWCPSLKVLRFHSTDRDEQERLRLKLRDPGCTQVVVTTYETVKTGGLANALSGVVWRSVFLDEGHRIKNEHSEISKACHRLRSRFRVILTGTPIQNNLHQFGALLSWLAPNIFTELSLFDAAFSLHADIHAESFPTQMNRKQLRKLRMDESASAGGTEAAQPANSAGTADGGHSQHHIDRALLACAHYLMQPFVLRRLKSEVEQRLPPKQETKIDCPMTPLQRDLTRLLLLREMRALFHVDSLVRPTPEEPASNSSSVPALGAPESSSVPGTGFSEPVANNQTSVEGGGAAAEEGAGESSAEIVPEAMSKNLMSLLTQLRKVANHPFLFSGVDSVSMDGAATEEIVSASGKMLVLDKLLRRLKERGHRVVLFSQYTRTLDIISDYLDLRGYRHCRLDGSTNRVMREVKITVFNKSTSDLFIFCLSTRAGGEGVNLYTADTVILFDRCRVGGGGEVGCSWCWCPVFIRSFS